MKFSAVCVTVIAMAAGSVWAQAPAKKIQCWTDKSGQRMCGDNVPPEYAGSRLGVHLIFEK